MADFFSLNTERRRHDNDSTEIYTKGIDLWQQYYQQQQQQRDDHQQRVINFSDTSINKNGIGLRSGYGGSIVGSGINCQDCGNQAKKDCTNLRCRTCCKSRGFRCVTHVKSTWVPAAKRREKHQQLTVLQHQNRLQLEQCAAGGGGGNNNNNNNGSKRIKEINPGLEVTTFPAEVNSTAMFRCVKVFTPTENLEEQYAYQTAISIGGHVFKGILYDQGQENHYIVHSAGGGNESSSGGGNNVGGQLQYQQLNLLTSMAARTNITELSNAAGQQQQVEEMPLLDNPLIYSTPLNDFMSGTQFFRP